MYDKLLKLSLSFLKKAGLLEVPESTLKELQQWAVGYYCFKLIPIILEKLKIYDSRIKVQKILDEIVNSNNFDLLSKIADGDISPEYILPKGDTVSDTVEIEWNKFENKKDPISNMNGVYTKVPNFNFYISKDRNSYDIVIKGKSLNIDAYGIPKNQVIKILNSNKKAIHNEISDFIDFCNSFDRVYNHTFNNLKEVLIECKKYKQFNEGSGARWLTLISPLSGEKYDIAVFFILENRPDRLGDWVFDSNPSDRLGEMHFYFKPFLPYDHNQLFDVIHDINRIARHELQHAIQSIIKAEKGIIKFPETSLIRDIREEQRKKEKKEKDKKELPKFNDNIEHAHKNIEFPTRLSDSINDFKVSVRKFPKILHKEFFKAWVAIIPIIEFTRKAFDLYYDNVKNRFYKEFRDSIEIKFDNEYSSLKNANEMFGSFKQHAPEKYKKLVKEFYKEVADTL